MRLLILAHGKLSPEDAKTATGILRYSEDTVVGLVDEEHAGDDGGDPMGPPAEGIPVVASVEEGLDLDPDALAIGIAPVGGQLPDAWRPDLEAALEAGLTVVGGLHTHLSEDPELAALADETDGTLRDVRKPDVEQRVATGAALEADAVVVTTAGTDCSSGKMTTTLELWQEARDRGLEAGWVATGQTGLMIGADAGAPMDAVVSDFVAGVTEACVVGAAEDNDIVFVEGQGSIAHPGYSGVTSSIVLGSFPDVLVLCDVPAREHHDFPSVREFPKQGLAAHRDLLEDLLAEVSGGTVAAASLVPRGLDEAEARTAFKRAEEELGVPADDVVGGDRGRILDAVLEAAADRPEAADAVDRLRSQGGFPP
jgi:uncharacterized NAD-dependent epimerase/dehydratase family protein